MTPRGADDKQDSRATPCSPLFARQPRASPSCWSATVCGAPAAARPDQLRNRIFYPRQAAAAGLRHSRAAPMNAPTIQRCAAGNPAGQNELDFVLEKESFEAVEVVGQARPEKEGIDD